MLILTDLDDTLFQTSRKYPETGGIRRVMSYLADGSESGFATEQQQQMLGWLEAGSIVPVTARSRDVLARVNIPQAPAICANGGCIIMADGQTDPDWHASLHSMSRTGESVRSRYHAITAELDPVILRHWIAREGDLDLYIAIKSNVDEGESLDAIQTAIGAGLPPGWRIHRNGNNLAVLPFWLNKRHAAARLIETARQADPHRLIVGVGDSHSDVGFMDLCDFAVTPTRSQIWASIRAENNWCT